MTLTKKINFIKCGSVTLRPTPYLLKKVNIAHHIGASFVISKWADISACINSSVNCYQFILANKEQQAAVETWQRYL